MECAQINIVGGTGTTLPAKTYSIPGIYKANDPGILVNIYSMTPSSKYTIPGPPVFTCAGEGAVPASNSGSLTPTTLLTVAVPEATAAPAAVEEPTCEAAQWQQCGGTNFNGCTTCTSPYSCKQINAYYYQCS